MLYSFVFTEMAFLHLFKLLLAAIILVSGFNKITVRSQMHMCDYNHNPDACEPSFIADPSIIK